MLSDENEESKSIDDSPEELMSIPNACVNPTSFAISSVAANPVLFNLERDYYLLGLSIESRNLKATDCQTSEEYTIV